MKYDTDERLRSRWGSGEALAVGRAIMASLDPSQRAARAAAVLRVCMSRVAAPEAVRHVLELANDASRWSEAHDAFSEVRNLTLREERAPTDRVYATLLFVAENAAKTIYNASGSPAPFDDDAPWWIATCARAFVEAGSDPMLEQEVWAALTGRRGVDA